MSIHRWSSQLSLAQRIWLFGTLVVMAAVIALGGLMRPAGRAKCSFSLSTDVSIRQLAPQLNVTGKGLARELGLPLDVSKDASLGELGVTSEELGHAIHHIVSHRDATLKYYVYAALVLGGLVFMRRLGRPDGSGVKDRHDWYPRTPYLLCLFLSLMLAGFMLGKSPNPMEGFVKVLKSMVGLYPDPRAKALALVFFLILAIVGNKMICGWACPFGALQELIYSLPILRRMKRRKLPFIVTNTIRAGLFLVMLLFLFGIVGGRKGTVLYHYVNPFNLFNREFEGLSIALTVIIVLVLSLMVYRPFCQLVCPFGLLAWVAERFSINRVRIDREKCTKCGACVGACPLEAAKGRVAGKRLPADCFSCARCLNVCPVDAIQYTSIFNKDMTEHAA